MLDLCGDYLGGARRISSRSHNCSGLAFTYADLYIMGWMHKWPRLTQLRDQLETELGKEAYNAAWERGKALDLETVVQDLLAEFGGGCLMELGQLEAFDRVARDGTFTRAAESLGLTQPAVSTRISLLEAELGGELFERRGRQLFLTPLGERFLPLPAASSTCVPMAYRLCKISTPESQARSNWLLRLPCS